MIVSYSADDFLVNTIFWLVKFALSFKILQETNHWLYKKCLGFCRVYCFEHFVSGELWLPVGRDKFLPTRN